MQQVGADLIAIPIFQASRLSTAACWVDGAYAWVQQTLSSPSTLWHASWKGNMGKAYTDHMAVNLKQVVYDEVTYFVWDVSRGDPDGELEVLYLFVGTFEGVVHVGKKVRNRLGTVCNALLIDHILLTVSLWHPHGFVHALLCNQCVILYHCLASPTSIFTNQEKNWILAKTNT